MNVHACTSCHAKLKKAKSKKSQSFLPLQSIDLKFEYTHAHTPTPPPPPHSCEPINYVAETRPSQAKPRLKPIQTGASVDMKSGTRAMTVWLECSTCRDHLSRGLG